MNTAQEMAAIASDAQQKQYKRMMAERAEQKIEKLRQKIQNLAIRGRRHVLVPVQDMHENIQKVLEEAGFDVRQIMQVCPHSQDGQKPVWCVRW